MDRKLELDYDYLKVALTAAVGATVTLSVASINNTKVLPFLYFAAGISLLLLIIIGCIFEKLRKRLK